MKKYLKTGIIASLCAFQAYTSCGQEITTQLKNQFNFWGTANPREPLLYQFGGRYLPEFSIERSFKDSSLIDAEISFNSLVNSNFSGKEHLRSDAKISPYRAWLRYSNNHLEIRAGLQKINFGSASALRPLMWFDQIDPRDPLQLTDGVYAVLGRYYFTNNTNIWLWGLIGNDTPRGWDAVPTIKNKPEYGGRIQLPAGKGEMAFSIHHRTANYTSLESDTSIIGDIPKFENKIGVDGKWDVGIGVWYEVVAKHNGLNNQYLNTWNDYINIGVDYTFGLGNGLNVMGEFFRANSSNLLFGKGQRAYFSALTTSYPFGMINNVSYIMFLNWNDMGFYQYINFQRQYDYWTFYFMAYWNPESYNLYNLGAERTLYAGKGIQFLAVWNF